MTTKAILLVGSSVRAATESAVRAGFSVVACDHFGDRETLSAADHWIPMARLPQWDGEAIECVFASGKLGSGDFLADSQLKFRHATPSDFARVSSPDFLSRLAEDSGVQFPETSHAPRRESDWLEKHRYSTGGLGVRWAKNLEMETPDRSSSENQDRYFQRFQFGRVLGASYVADGNEAVLVGVCNSLHRRIASLPFFYVGSSGPVSVSPSVRAALQQLGQTLVQKTNLTGPINIDVIVHDDCVTLIEVNPRWSASMEIVERHWMEILGESCSLFQPMPIWKKRLKTTPLPIAKWVKRYAFAKQEMHVDPNQFCESHGQTNSFWKDVPANEVTVNASQPVATLIADLSDVSIWEYRRLLTQRSK